MLLFFRILGWILAAPVVMRLGPARAFALFQPKAVAVPSAGAPPVEQLVARADRLLLFRLFGRLLFRTRCYKRTLVLYRLLRLHGYDARAIIGVDREAGGIAAHAWLTVNGHRLEDPTFTPPRDFTPLLEIGERIERLTGA